MPLIAAVIKLVQIDVKCFPLQLAQVLLLRQSEAWCLGHAQLKHNLFFESISLVTHSLDLWPGL